jgi:sulfite reductase (NADPH) flavoprotein alpha-component
MPGLPYIPESAPFTAEQRAWLNGFLAGLFSQCEPSEITGAQSNRGPRKNAEPLLILFGSQTGTAEGLAKRFARESEERGFAPRVLALNDFEQANLTAAGQAIIISSTWGDGDPPDNAANFWSWLKSESAPRLENLWFAVLGLGDKNYSDFCGASKKFDTRLEALGARRLVPRGECDVDYELTANEWMQGLWEKLVTKNGRACSVSNISENRATNGNRSTNGMAGALSVLNGKPNPLPARLLKNVLLNKPGSAKEVRHYEINLEDSGLSYEVGDALGIAPSNCPALVNDCLAASRFTGEEAVKCGDATLSLREALTRRFDLRKPTRELLAASAKQAPGCEFAPLLAPERAADLKQWLLGREIIDVLLLTRPCFTPDELLLLLRPLAPRLYSISSSPKAHPGEVHLTVSTVRYESCGRARKGVASTFLADRARDQDCLNVFVQPSPGFKPPADSQAPVIMVGPGTGIAPFRAFLEERQATGAKGKNWLFFGEQKRATDFLYEQEITAWRKSGLLLGLDLAFSRDQTEKIYVQDRLLQNAAEVWRWLEEGAHFYVCGEASRMARDVDAALHRIIETAGGKTEEDAKNCVARLKAEKRYQRDVY